jgi:pilus assembly protein CpaB
LLLVIGLIIVVLALAVGGYMFFLGGGGGEVAPETLEQEPTPVPEQEVIVAAQDIPRGTIITPDSGAVVTTTWPREAVTELAVTNINDTYGRITRQGVARGTPILRGMLTEQAGELVGTGSDAALQIPEGLVAYALPVSRYSSVAWALQPGDHVDVLLSLLLVDVEEEFQTVLPNQAACATEAEGCQDGTLGRLEALPNGWIVNVFPSEGQRPRVVTQLTVQDAVVLRVGDWDKELEAAEETPTTEGEVEAEGEDAEATPPPSEQVKPLTLVVTPQDAAVLKYAEEVGASMDLVLRSAQDSDQTVSTESVTLKYLLERFSIEIPPKLPQSTEPPLSRLRSGPAGGSVPVRVEGGRAPQVRGGVETAQ